jgi:hypothetical protein
VLVQEENRDASAQAATGGTLPSKNKRAPKRP